MQFMTAVHSIAFTGSRSLNGYGVQWIQFETVIKQKIHLYKAVFLRIRQIY